MAYNDEVLVYNSHGKEYEVPRVLVYSIYGLERGDHIAFHRLRGTYWHHAIVEDVDTECCEIRIIEYTNSATGFLVDNSSSPKRPGIAEVMRNTLQFQEITVHLMIHEQLECSDPETVVWRARSKLGERKYNPFTNNCEHFAMWCKTGRSSSDQVNKAKEMLGKEVVSQTASQSRSEFARAGARMGAKEAATRAASRAGSEFVRAGPRMAAKEAASRAASQAGSEFARAGARMAAKEAASRAASQVGSEFARASARMAAKEAASRAAAQAGGTIVRTGVSRSVSSAGQEMAMASSAGAGVGGAVAGGVLAAGVEGLSMLYDIDCAHTNLRAGRISEEQFTRTVGKRFVSGTGSVAGSTTGAFIGQAIIPVPILGAVVGGVIGGLSGSLFGNIFGNVLFD